MAGGKRREPRCSNSWRPSDGPLSPQSGPPRRRQSSVPHERLGRFSPAHPPHPGTRQYSNIDQRPTPSSLQATPEPPVHVFKNPNLMTIVPRRSRTAHSSSLVRGLGQYEEIEEERLPQVWHPSIDDLIRRTAHDYDLVMNYERDAEGGQRWLPADITRIRNVGKNLHRDIFALRRWQRVVAQQGDQDKIMMMHIKREANFVKLLCERVQSAIAKCEQKCNLELLRDGVYAQDEDGNLYKPTAPHEFVAEGGYLHNVPPLINEGVEDGRWDYHQYYNQGQYPDYGSRATLGMLPDAEPSSPPKRNLAVDFAFQLSSFDRLKSEAAYQSSEQPYEQRATPRAGRLEDGRISEPHHEQSRSKLFARPHADLRLSKGLSIDYPGRRHHSPSPDTRDQSPASTRSAEDIKPRSRGRNNFNDRNGVSRRQAKRDRERNRSPPATIGHLGNHELHY